MQKVRTDLAVEAHETMLNTSQLGDAPIHGVRIHERTHKRTGTHITHVTISTKNGAKALGKPMGHYITMENTKMSGPDENPRHEIALELARQLRTLIPSLSGELSILAVGLGNREVTADALGPSVIDRLCITRHIVKEYGKAAYPKEKIHLISSLTPGVMAKNGMETAEIIKGVIRETQPDVMVVIDALAARNTKRLNNTIQLTDTGILPGSGVGNHRTGLTEQSLGIPVIALGVPTVVDAATIVRNALECMEEAVGCIDYEDTRVQSTLYALNNMFVTNKDIDETIRRLSLTISEALNLAFS